MENSEKNMLTRGKITIIAIGSFVVLFLAYYSIMLAVSTARKQKELEVKFGLTEVGNDKIDPRFYSDSAFLNLCKEKTFFQSRILMAESDSLYITFNLIDSTANLELCGVKVLQAKMKDLKISKILTHGDSYAVYSLLSSPMTIVNDISTIQKEPIMIKMAPKDTSEFVPDIAPDTSDVEPVNYILYMDNGIKIYVYQMDDTITTNKHKLFFFDLNDRLRYASNSLKSVITLKVPEYHPFIKIRLPKADAKILYRSVPRHGQIAVFR
ncbi:MAG TPA: hypothetical protein DCZ51_04730 [Bacteroidales bacterium]|nr:hypothetical protein [Bacteroidales bacterium]